MGGNLGFLEAEVNEEYEHLLETEPGTPTLPTKEEPATSRSPSIEAGDTKPDLEMAAPTNGKKKSLAAPAVRRLAIEYNVSMNYICQYFRVSWLPHAVESLIFHSFAD